MVVRNSLPIIIAGLVLFWIVPFFITWRFGGWRALRGRYPEETGKKAWDNKFSGIAGTLGSARSYYGPYLRIAIGRPGVELSVAPPVIFHRPLLIPWSAVDDCRPVRFSIFRNAVQITVRDWPGPIILFGIFGKDRSFPLVLIKAYQSFAKSVGNQ
jgi:hypothetical protein